MNRRTQRSLANPAALAFSAALASLVGAAPSAAQAGSPQELQAEEDRVLAVVDASLEAITRGDLVGLTDLMIEEAFIVAVSGAEGAADYQLRTRAEERGRVFDADVVERGFDEEVQLTGGLATVWLPYDLYVDGEWSHCGVDTFTLFKVGDAWRIASLAYTVEQPPACRPHPDGPPAL